jgi:hypothetical protein
MTRLEQSLEGQPHPGKDEWSKAQKHLLSASTMNSEMSSEKRIGIDVS